MNEPKPMPGAYKGFCEMYLRHMASTYSFLMSPGKGRCFCPNMIQPLVKDMTILHQEINGEKPDPEAVKAVWKRSHDRGFL